MKTIISVFLAVCLMGGLAVSAEGTTLPMYGLPTSFSSQKTGTTPADKPKIGQDALVRYNGQVVETIKQSNQNTLKEFLGFELGKGEKQKTINPPIVLMYHRLSDELPSDAFTITSTMFERDIKYLKEAGYTFCTADDLHRKIQENSTEKLVAITFDDGYESDLAIAVPILQKYNANATFFVIGTNVGSPGYLTGTDIQKMAESGVAQIGNHSYALHEQGYDTIKTLCYTGTDDAMADIKRNSEFLGGFAGQKITAYSFPNGLYSPYLLSRLRKEGMAVFTSDEEVIVPGVPSYGRFNRPFDITAEEIVKSVRYR